MGLFDNELKDIPIGDQIDSGIDKKTGLFDDVLFGQSSQPSFTEGVKKAGREIIGGIGQNFVKYGQDFKSLLQEKQPLKAAAEAVELGTRPLRGLLFGAGRALAEIPLTPFLSAVESLTKQKQDLELPVLGEFTSFQEQKRRLEPEFGTGFSVSFPILNYLLDLTVAKPNILRLPIRATPKPAVLQYFGPAAKNLSEETLGTWNQMTKWQAAIDQLKFENPESINIQELQKSGLTAKEANSKAMQIIDKRSETITPEEHLETLYQIGKSIEETPEQVAKSLPNYLNKYALFEKILPDISDISGIETEKLTLLRNDTLTDLDINNAIKDVEKLKFSTTDETGSYKTAIGELYKKYPGLYAYQHVFMPETILYRGGIDSVYKEMEKMGLDQIVPYSSKSFNELIMSPIKSKAMLIKRLRLLGQAVNREVDLKSAPSALSDVINQIRKETPETRGYKVGFSPLEYTPVVPKQYASLPRQNFLGKIIDSLGFRGVSRNRINLAFQSKFSELFAKTFSTGIKDKLGITYDIREFPSVFKKSGREAVEQKPVNIFDKLYEIQKANKRLSITELSAKDLSGTFAKDDVEKLLNMLRTSRVLPSSLTGLGVNVVNRLRQNPAFDNFYRAVLLGHFQYSPGFALRRSFKFQILGGFEGKPINFLRFNSILNFLHEKYPNIFATRKLPTASELKGLMKIVGRSILGIDPASELWIQSLFDLETSETAIKNTIESPNFFEKLLGYSTTQDIVDLARSFARKNNTTIEKIAESGNLAQELKDLTTEVFHYTPGFLTSPALGTLNTIFFPIKFDVKVLRATGKWFAKQPVITRGAIIETIIDGIRNSDTPQAKKFIKEHSRIVSALTYLLPYTAFLDIFQDVANTIGDVPRRTSKVPGDILHTFEGNFLFGGLMFGILNQLAQNEGIIPQTQYISFTTGKASPQYIPKGFKARAKIFLGTFLNFLWPGGSKILGLFPAGIGEELQKVLPERPSQLPKKERKKI